MRGQEVVRKELIAEIMRRQEHSLAPTVASTVASTVEPPSVPSETLPATSDDYEEFVGAVSLLSPSATEEDPFSENGEFVGAVSLLSPEVTADDDDDLRLALATLAPFVYLALP